MPDQGPACTVEAMLPCKQRVEGATPFRSTKLLFAAAAAARPSRVGLVDPASGSAEQVWDYVLNGL